MVKRLLDAIVLSGAMLYILLGVSITPLHGDELTQIYMARDSFYIAQGDWGKLPYTVLGKMDQEVYLRLINGTVNKTLIGFAWIAQGHALRDLPGLYDWTLTLSLNRFFGNVPSDADLILSRWPSALFTALTVIPLFLLVRQLRCSRPIVYFTVLVYALHPVILLNGRRAMMEGSLIFGSLATIYWLVMVIQANRDETPHNFLSRFPFWLRYATLGLLAGFTIAAKLSGVFIAAAVLIVIIVDGLQRNDARRLALCLAITLVSMSVIWFVLNPAYWHDPMAAFGVMLRERAYLLASQTKSSPLRYANLWQRLDAIVAQPFMAPPQYYELIGWNNLIGDQITDYQASPLAGLNPGILGKALLTTLAGIGASVLVSWGRKMQPVAWVMLAWLGVTLLETLMISLSWQRYYLPLMLVAIVLSGVGGEYVFSALRRWQSSRIAMMHREQLVQETSDARTA
jgi:hypothetical protein